MPWIDSCGLANVGGDHRTPSVIGEGDGGSPRFPPPRLPVPLPNPPTPFVSSLKHDVAPSLLSPLEKPDVTPEWDEASSSKTPRPSVTWDPTVEAIQEAVTEATDIRKALAIMSLQISTNLKFTKAIYRGTKRSLTGPSYEPSRLENDDITASMSFFTAASIRDGDYNFDVPLQSGQRKSGDRREHLKMPGAAIGLSPPSPVMISDLAHMKQLSIPTSIATSSQDRMESGESACSTVTTIMDQHLALTTKSGVRVWRFTEDRNSSSSARCFHYLRLCLSVLSVILSCVESFDENLDVARNTVMNCIMLSFELLFAAELGVRLCACRDRCAFIFNGYNFVDFLSVCPSALRIHVLLVNEASLEINGIFAIVPVFRLLKVLRYFDTFQLLLSAFRSAAEALPMLIFTMSLIASTFAGIIYYCEPRSSIPSMPLALYFAVITVSTVGYGDFTPTTGAGKVWTCILSVIGPMYMAIPIGIIGHAFSMVWEDRHRLLMLHQMRRCVENLGYTPKDLKLMFELIDRNKDGTLDSEEWAAWLDMMDIRMPDHIIWQVFQSFDQDDEGTIDFQELLRGLYPNKKGKLYKTIMESTSRLSKKFTKPLALFGFGSGSDSLSGSRRQGNGPANEGSLPA